MSDKKKTKRKLTKEESRRKAAFEQRKAEMEAQGYRMRDLTMGLLKANVMALVLGIPLAVVLFVAFFVKNTSDAITFRIWYLPAFFAALIVLPVVHERIHGIVWAIYAPGHWKAVEFGFIKEYLTPYCTCSEPLKKYQYIMGGLMPTLLLGFLPAVTGVIIGSYWLLMIGICMIFGGGGDMAIVLEMLKHRSKAKHVVYMDHPYRAGVVVFEKQ